MKMMRGFALVLGLVALCLGLLVSRASASPPEKISSSGSGTYSFLPGELCSFAVDLYMEIEEVDTLFLDKEGNYVMFTAHIREKDSFTNVDVDPPKTLEGAPYRFIIRGFLDENGEWVVFANGILQKVRLPDGKLWIGAGRTIPWYGFGLVADKGTPASIDDLCAGLAQ